VRTLLGTFDLFDRRGGVFVPCELYEGFSEHNLRNFEQDWRPAFRAAQSSNLTVQDAHWDWRRKHAHVEPRLNYRSFVVECAGNTQGMLIVEMAAHRCRLEEQAGKHLAYSEFLATAPWNRVIDPNPWFKGVGRLLISTAVNVSVDEEFEGRVGLHSLPDADDFYRGQCGMTDLGPDTQYPQQLRYFEMTRRQAEMYLAVRW
jgi:hypothetical protein